jgi:hygromycin-B 4-O-kinase
MKRSIETIKGFVEDLQGTKVTDLEPVGYGAWSSAYFFRAEGRDYVIRFSPYDEDFKKDAFAANFASDQLPIPRITEMGEAWGEHYAISEKAEGVVLELLDQEQMLLTLPSLMSLLDALRNADVTGTTGYGGWDTTGKGYFPSWKENLLDIASDRPDLRIHGWREKLASSAVGTKPFDDLYRRFASLVQLCPEDRYLIHADLLHYNLLVLDHQVSAVIDWGCSKYGDFLYELAWFTFWAPWHETLAGIDFKTQAVDHYADIGLQVPNLDERVLCYELHIALDGIAYCAFIGNWEQVERIISQAQDLVTGAF